MTLPTQEGRRLMPHHTRHQVAGLNIRMYTGELLSPSISAKTVGGFLLGCVKKSGTHVFLSAV